MKHRTLHRFLSLALALALTIGGSAAVWAADSFPSRESRYQSIRSKLPQWEETEISCQGALGVLRGTLTVPKSREDKVPVAILLHGLNTDRTWCEDIAWSLADHGIASVRFDYGGNGASDGAQEEMTVSTELKDTVSILSYVKTLAFTDADNIFLVGKSMGGVEAVLAAQSHQEDIKGLCLWYPGFGITAGVRSGTLLGECFSPADPPETLTAAGYTFGRQFIREAQSLDIASACRNYRNPVLILHGDSDRIAPITYSFEMQKEFPDCSLNVFPGGYHGFTGFQELEALDATVRFIQTHMDE